MKPLPQDRIDKTLLGIVTDWTELFTEHRYGKMVLLPNYGGSKVDHPSDFYFLSSETPSVKSLGPAKARTFLYVKANPKIEPIIDSRMTPPIGHAVKHRTDIAAFKIIPWPDYGHALVCATDYNSIANPWVCFIPLSAVPEINPENTAMFSAADWPKPEYDHDY